MLKEDLQSIHTTLGTLLPRVSADDAATLRIVRRNIAALADQAGELEMYLVPDLPTALPSEEVRPCHA